MTFIRAPFVAEAGDEVEVLASVEDRIVAVRYQKQIALAFHPELDEDMRIHEMFLSLCEKTDSEIQFKKCSLKENTPPQTALFVYTRCAKLCRMQIYN